MSDCCCNSGCSSQTNVRPRYRKVLWMALLINVAMFAVEIIGSLQSGSVSLLADAIDFAGDAANYGISLAVLSLGLAWRSRAALVKGLSMAAFGVFVLGKTAWSALSGIPPEPLTMGVVAIMALVANGGVALMLYAFRDGDANMRSVWVCSRNDAINNLLVIGAGFVVLWTGSGLPDLVVALIMALLGLQGGWQVVRQARYELAARGVPV